MNWCNYDIVLEDKKCYEELDKRGITLGTVLFCDGAYFLFVGRQTTDFLLERLKKTPFTKTGYKRKSIDNWWLQDGVSAYIQEITFEKYQVVGYCEKLLKDDYYNLEEYIERFKMEHYLFSTLQPYNLYYSDSHNVLYLYDGSEFFSVPVGKDSDKGIDVFYKKVDKIRKVKRLNSMKLLGNCYSRDLEVFLMKWRLMYGKK